MTSSGSSIGQISVNQRVSPQYVCEEARRSLNPRAVPSTSTLPICTETSDQCRIKDKIADRQNDMLSNSIASRVALLRRQQDGIVLFWLRYNSGVACPLSPAFGPGIGVNFLDPATSLCEPDV